MKDLNLFLDEKNILRCKGRLDNCNLLNFDQKNPILLPKSNHLTELLIWDAHLCCKHMGPSVTLNAIRRRGLWISQGRSVIKNVLKKCVTCAKINSYSFRYPRPNSFVGDRVNFVKPFNYTGIDYTAHFMVKFGENIVKMYLLLFTCLNTRAVHLDLVPSLNCEHFLLSFSKFCNLYTIPAKIFSDNASTFLQGMGLLSDSFHTNDFSEYLEKNNITHVRIPLYAAWIGTFWERMIRCVKAALAKAIGRGKIEYFSFCSLLIEVQNSINSRPLSYQDTDVSFTPLTPNSFLKLEAGKSLLLDNFSGSELEIPNRNQLVKALEVRQNLFEKFKETWYENYLLSLREASRDIYQGAWEDKIRVGDVVLISNPVKVRALWQMGRVLDVLPGKDGKVRCVRLVRPDRSEGVYPISNLYPLELSVSTINESSTSREDSTNKVKNKGANSGESRPRRKAALDCLEKLNLSN